MWPELEVSDSDSKGCRMTSVPTLYENVSWTEVDFSPAQAIHNLYPHRQVSLAAIACQNVPQEFVPCDHKTPMSVRGAPEGQE